MALGINCALMTWAVQNFRIPKFSTWNWNNLNVMNPILTDEDTRPLYEKIKNLRNEIDHNKH